jgi:hypothetical protein
MLLVCTSLFAAANIASITLSMYTRAVGTLRLPAMIGRLIEEGSCRLPSAQRRAVIDQGEG